MLTVIACFAGILALVLITEYLGRRKALKGEYQRKFLHVTAGIFIAFWPWLLSWRQIQFLAILMLLVLLVARFTGYLTYHGHVRRITYGDILLALAVLVCAIISHNRVFFTIAILEVAVADGLAAVAGVSFGKHWEYKIFGYKKTVIGSMVFWIASAEILAAGLLAASSLFQLDQYYYLVIFLPPALTLLETLSVYGLDNLLIPVLTIFVLRLFQV